MNTYKIVYFTESMDSEPKTLNIKGESPEEALNNIGKYLESMPYAAYVDGYTTETGEYISLFTGAYIEQIYDAQYTKFRCKLYVACRQSGDRIEEVDSLAEGIETIRRFYEEDEAEGIREDDFYSVDDEEHHTIWW